MARARLPAEVRAWGAVSLLSDLAHETVTALLPAFLASLGAGPIALGAIEGGSDALSTVAKLLGGRLADRLHRLKRVTLVGYLTTALALPGVAFATAALHVGLLRAVGWFGRGLRSPLRDVLIVRDTPPELLGRAFGLERALDQVGAVLAPLAVLALGALGFGMRATIGLALVPGLASFLLVLLWVRERPAEPPAARAGGGEPPGPAMRRFLAAVGIFGAGDFAKTMLVLWAIGAGPQGSLGETFGLGVALYGLYNLVSVVAAYVGGSLSDALGRKPVLVAGYLCGAAGALAPLALDPGWLGCGLALGLSGALVGTQEAVERAWAAELAGSRRGRAFGLLHSINGLGDLVASLGVGALWTFAGLHAAFGAAAALMLGGTLVLARVPGRLRAARSPD